MGGEADGRQSQESSHLGVGCHLRSAGTLGSVAFERHVEAGRGAERAHLLPLQIDHSIPARETAVVSGPSSARSSSNSPWLQSHNASPLEYGFGRIPVAAN